MEVPASPRPKRSHSLSSLDLSALGGASTSLKGFFAESPDDFLVFDEVLCSARDTEESIEAQFDRVAVPVANERVPDNLSHVRRYLRATHGKFDFIATIFLFF